MQGNLTNIIQTQQNSSRDILEMAEELLNNVEDNNNEANEIAEICGFELTKEFEVEVTVQYSVTVNARDEESAQNAIYDIDFDSVSYNDDSISYLSSSVDRIEI